MKTIRIKTFRFIFCLQDLQAKLSSLDEPLSLGILSSSSSWVKEPFLNCCQLHSRGRITWVAATNRNFAFLNVNRFALICGTGNFVAPIAWEINRKVLFEIKAGAVAKWSKALLSREKINEDQKIPGLPPPPARAKLKKSFICLIKRNEMIG